jgi:hypothetical protein
MWSVIVASAVTIAAVLYMQGPIVALGLTAVSSLALLVVLRIGEHKTQGAGFERAPLQAIDGTKDDADMMFPPLKQKAS